MAFFFFKGSFVSSDTQFWSMDIVHYSILFQCLLGCWEDEMTDCIKIVLTLDCSYYYPL